MKQLQALRKSYGRSAPLPFMEMTEKLLQYIWQHQYFNPSGLRTTAGDALQIVFPGYWNRNQGPDFSEAQVKIGNTLMAGSIELHIRSSLWYDHGDSNDPNYNNVILHVVYEHNDAAMPRIPVLELEPLIPKILLERYTALMNGSGFIPCSLTIGSAPQLVWLSWKDRLVAERLTRKSQVVFNYLQENNGHWEECFWWLVARNFGSKVNAEAFEQIARSLPLKVMARHRNQVIQLEALLFGQAGLLNEKYGDAYPNLLAREYGFLKKKYGLQPISSALHFLRMRPGNFPTIRLAQLAAMLHVSDHLFSGVLDCEDVNSMRGQLNLCGNDYWHYHYLFDEPSPFRKKILGKEMIDNVISNTVIPFLFAYGSYKGEEKFKTKAVDWLQMLEPEINVHTKGFVDLKVDNCSSFDSQALIELKTQYCDQRRCLHCAIGNAILKTGTRAEQAQQANSHV